MEQVMDSPTDWRARLSLKFQSRRFVMALGIQLVTGSGAKTCFPLPFVPATPWSNTVGSKNTHFGAPRSQINPKTGKAYPTHGACDLIAPANTPVYAVARGTVWYHKLFYTSYSVNEKTKQVSERYLHELVIVHDHFIVRYCEIEATLARGIGVCSKVEAGQHIANVGLNFSSDQMLHFEMFKDTSRRDGLSVTDAKHKYKHVPQRDYDRRDDLLDPTEFLNLTSAALITEQVKQQRQVDDAMRQIRNYTRHGAGRVHSR
jgi:murein DD-endopeptidase MepM/ murein hydrolase activator NlpD